MSTQNYKEPPPGLSEAWEELQKDMRRMTSGSQLECEVRALRQDIKELRALLEPVPSLIATGRDVLDEFKRLTGKENDRG